MQSFLGTYKVLARVLPKCAHILAPLEEAITGQQSKDPTLWSQELTQSFEQAQKFLSSSKCITLPRATDQLWIVTDSSIKALGLAATLYTMRQDKLFLAGHFSTKLRTHQRSWLPCELETLPIATATKHFSPYIIQSHLQACVLTDSKPCVEAAEKLCRGKFSASPRAPLSFPPSADTRSLSAT